MLKFIFQKILNKKWMAFSLLLGNILLIAIACANPMYSQAVLQRTLTQDMNSYMLETNHYPGAISVKTSYSLYSEENSAKIDRVSKEFEAWLEEMDVPTLAAVTYNLTNVEVSSSYQDKSSLVQAVSYTDVADHINMLHGTVCSSEVKDNVIEVIVAEKTYVKQNLILDQELTLTKVKDADGNPYRFKVVGIFENKDEQDPYWEYSPNDWYAKFLMSEEAFETVFAASENKPNFTRGCYAVLDYTQMDVDRAEVVLEATQKYEEVLTDLEYTYVTVNYEETLENFLPKEQRLNTTITMLQIPTFVLLIAFIFMVSGQMLDMEQNEISVFKSRGASKSQIILLYLLQSVLIAVAAFVIGIPVGMMLCKIIGASNAFLEFVQRAALQVKVSPKVLGVGAIAAFVSICTMVLPVFKLANTSIVAAKRQKNRKKKRTWWKVIGLDVILLAVALYGWYQFQGEEAYLAQKAADGAALDPTLYACTSVFMLGAGLLILRILPWIIRLVFEIGKKWWSPGVYASFLRIMRTNNNQGFLVVFLVLTVSMGIFSTQTARTINANAEEQIRYSIGADIVVQEQWKDNSLEILANENSENPEEIELTYVEPDFGKYLQMDGVESVAKVLVEDDINISVDGGKVDNVTVMGIHTKDFGETAWMKDGLLGSHWYAYLNAISQNANAVLVSSNLQEQYGYELGDIINYSNADGKYVRGIIYGFVDYWPSYAPETTVQDKDGLYKTADHYLIVAHLSQLQSAWGIEPYQVWIKTTDSSQFLYDYAEENDVKFTLFEDTAAELVSLKNESVFQGTNGVLTISFIVVLLLCAAGFLIYWILSIQSRTLQFGIFRAMGMSKNEVLMMLVVEQIFISGTSIGGGVLVGQIVSKLYVPLIQIAYATTDRSLPLEIIDAVSDYVRLGSVIGLMIVVCMIVLGVLISKIKITQALKLGED